MKWVWIILVIVVIAGAIYYFTRPNYQIGNSSSVISSSPVSQSSVSAENFSFNPSSIEVAVGTEVTFTNNDSTAHTITSDDGAFDSGQLASGQSFKHTFTQAGTFTYHCSIHTTMHGNVIVK